MNWVFKQNPPKKPWTLWMLQTSSNGSAIDFYMTATGFSWSIFRSYFHVRDIINLEKFEYLFLKKNLKNGKKFFTKMEFWALTEKYPRQLAPQGLELPALLLRLAVWIVSSVQHSWGGWLKNKRGKRAVFNYLDHFNVTLQLVFVLFQKFGILAAKEKQRDLLLLWNS